PPRLGPGGLPRAAHRPLAAGAEARGAQPAGFPRGAVPDSEASAGTLTRWFRRFIEVRDSDGAERCIVSAVRAGASREELARMLFAAATDHRYLEGGHVLDFTNKALEALDAAGWDLAEAALGSLARGLSEAERMEESNAWRHPVDLIEILEEAFAELPAA